MKTPVTLFWYPLLDFLAVVNEGDAGTGRWQWCMMLMTGGQCIMVQHLRQSHLRWLHTTHFNVQHLRRSHLRRLQTTHFNVQHLFFWLPTSLGSRLKKFSKSCFRSHADNFQKLLWKLTPDSLSNLANQTYNQQHSDKHDVHDTRLISSTHRVRSRTFWTSGARSTPTWRMKSSQERRLSAWAPLTTWGRRWGQLGGRTTPTCAGEWIGQCRVRLHYLGRWRRCNRIGLAGFATSSLWWLLVLQHAAKTPATCSHTSHVQPTATYIWQGGHQVRHWPTSYSSIKPDYAMMPPIHRFLNFFFTKY